MTRSGILLLGESSLGSGWREGQRWLWRNPAGETPRPPPTQGRVHAVLPSIRQLQPHLGRHLPRGAFSDSCRPGPEPVCPHGRLDVPRCGPGPTATWQTGPGAAALPRPPSYLLSVSRDLEEVGLLPLMPTQCQAPQSGPAREPWGRPSCGADASAAHTRQLWDPGQLLLHCPSAHPLWKPGSCGLDKPSAPLPGREALDTRKTCWAMAAARGEQELISLRARRGSAFSLGVCHREAKLRLRKGG